MLLVIIAKFIFEGKTAPSNKSSRFYKLMSSLRIEFINLNQQMAKIIKSQSLVN